jgi:molecular chaperone GrpE (heat shock protein)
MNGFLKKNKPISGNSIPGSSNNEEWKALFKNISIIDNGLAEAREANNNLHARLSRVLDAFNKISEQQGSMLIQLIKIVDYCMSLNPAPAEIEAVEAQLLSILKEQGVSIWSPAIGEPLPEHCEAIAVKETSEFAAQTVLEVLSPGYLWGETILLRRPRVVLSQIPKLEQIRPQLAESTALPAKGRKRPGTKKEKQFDEPSYSEDQSLRVYQEDSDPKRESPKKEE